MSKTFCIKPWTHSMVYTNGDIKLCCISSEVSEFNLKTSPITDWWTSDFVAGIRTQMLNGEQPEPCSVCFDNERRGVASYRQKSNKEYKIIEKYADKIIDKFDYPPAMPIDIEVGLTNLCNLKCLMCSENNSSSIAVENKTLKISVIDQSKYDVDVNYAATIRELIQTKPKVLNFKGGESLMVPVIKELLNWGLESNLLDDTVIHLTTNGTRLTKDWLELLHKIKNLRIMLSVDGTGPVNDYIRFGSNWDVVNESARQLSSIPNVNFVVHTTVMNLNILTICDVIEWCQSNNYYLDLDILKTPTIFKIDVLPEALLEKAKERLRQMNNEHTTMLLTVLNSAVSAPLLGLQKEINMRDQIRQVSILDVIPELGPYWNV